MFVSHMIFSKRPRSDTICLFQISLHIFRFQIYLMHCREDALLSLHKMQFQRKNIFSKSYLKILTVSMLMTYTQESLPCDCLISLPVLFSHLPQPVVFIMLCLRDFSVRSCRCVCFCQMLIGSSSTFLGISMGDNEVQHINIVK